MRPRGSGWGRAPEPSWPRSESRARSCCGTTATSSSPWPRRLFDRLVASRHRREGGRRGSASEGESGDGGLAGLRDCGVHGAAVHDPRRRIARGPIVSVSMDDRGPRVVIVGGGFGGLAAARALAKTPARVLLIDRTNHHLFQPLLYQVATAVLAT